MNIVRFTMKDGTVKSKFHDSISSPKEDLSDLSDFLMYEKTKGFVSWKRKSCTNTVVGKTIKTLDKHGYYQIKINKKTYRLHRIIWFLVYGKFPNGVIDHINGNRTDNRIENLRDATASENQRNRVEHRNGYVVGVTKYKRNSQNTKFGAFSADGKRLFIGYYPCSFQAEMASVMFDNLEIVNKKQKKLEAGRWQVVKVKIMEG